MGLMLACFRAGDRFDNLHTWSLRGLPRPPDDRHARERAEADPLFAVWGQRR